MGVGVVDALQHINIHNNERVGDGVGGANKDETEKTCVR